MIGGSRQALALVFLLPVGAAAQRVQLELRPHEGDTLRMRLDQVTEISSSRRGAQAGAHKQILTTLRMFSRAIVETTMPAGAVIVAITDSVQVGSSDEKTRQLAERSHGEQRGRHMRMFLTPDGTVALIDGPAAVPREVNDLLAVMPASFPRIAIAVGDTWMREMPIPPAASLGIPTGSVVRARFRLDSISRAGDLAYVSMRGTLASRRDPKNAPPGFGGVVGGSVILDRRRGWLSESRFLIQLRGTITYPGARDAEPMQFQMNITQHMQVFERR